jgi:hypothetical protein
MTNVTILHEAEVELWEAVAFYEEISAGLGSISRPKSSGRMRLSPHTRNAGRCVLTAPADTSLDVFPTSSSTHTYTIVSGFSQSHNANDVLPTGGAECGQQNQVPVTD